MDKKLVLSIVFTVLYAVITLICVLHHEVWADEAQVWQLCKYLSLPELFHHLHNEGHPALFYLLVMPFAKIFSNIIFMKLLCWGAMCFAVFLLFYYSPFPFYVKAAITLSAGFFYFLPVIARSYSLVPFLIFLAAMLYSKQKEHPILYCLVISALASLHAIMLCFCSVLFILFIWDNIIKNIKDKVELKRFILPVIIFLAVFLYTIWQLHDTTSENAYIKFYLSNILIQAIYVVVNFIINAYNNSITMENPVLSVIDIALIIAYVITNLLLWVNLLINDKRLFFIAFLGIMFQIAVYIFVYPTNIYVTRIFIALVILLFSFWILFANNKFNEKYKISSKKTAGILLSLLFIFTAYNGIHFYTLDIKMNYSSAKETVQFIKNNVKKDDLILIDMEPYNISLIYYLDRYGYKIFSIIRDKYIKYIIWDNNCKTIAANQLWLSYIKILKQQEKFKDKDFYVIIAYEKLNPKYTTLDKEYKNEFRLIYTSTKSIVLNENCSIYKYIGN